MSLRGNCLQPARHRIQWRAGWHPMLSAPTAKIRIRAVSAAQVAAMEPEPQLLDRLLHAQLPELMAEAAALRDQGHGRVITFSPKVFIPLTRLCRDSCGYCTFALPPQPGRRCYLTVDEVLAIARLGQQQGCAEALFTLGDKPELLYPEAAAELAGMGFSSTLEYVAAAAEAVLLQTGLLPHINAGVMDQHDLERLKAVSASQGLMLEGVAPQLAGPGGPHHGCPDKDPAVRLAVIDAAGRARVPFTSGLLIGIGESRTDRLAALVALAQQQRCHGHIQEVIIQNFRAKPGTAMHSHPEPPLEELLWTVAAARLLLGPAMNIQAPPNLTPASDAVMGGGGSGQDGGIAASWRALLDAGVNDWGGISPITRDFVNPEKSWPHLAPLAAATAAAGKMLLPRLPVYPNFLLDLGGSSGGGGGGGGGSSGSSSSCSSGSPWLSRVGGARSVAAAAFRASDSSGLLRGNSWVAGRPSEPDASSTNTSEQEHQQHQQQSQLDVEQQLLAPRAAAQPTQPQQQQQQGLLSSIPLPRKRQAKLWSIAVDDSGLLQGLPAPADVSADVQQLLAELLQTAPPPGSSSSNNSSSSSSGREWTQQEVELLLAARGPDMAAVVAAADRLRQLVCGDAVSYVVNRNINYTNVCTYGCKFCAFSKGKRAESKRGAPYLLPLAEISRRSAEAWQRGATEVCLQGGIHPDFTGQTYLDILAAVRQGAPAIHIHAFSPLEVSHGAASLGLPVVEFLAQLKAAGLNSLPGTAAEVLDDQVRAALCPDKLSTAEWLEVVGAAHSVGLRTTSTIMFGHCDSPAAWARHLLLLRQLQARTGGITEFVPLPFVHMEAPIFLQGSARAGPTLRECVLLHAVARLVLHPLISNIQASWVKMGPERAAATLLAAGCNDMGGSIMNESITRAAGAAYGQELPPPHMEQLITAAGRTAYQRTTLYGKAPPEQVAASFRAGQLEPTVMGWAPEHVAVL